MSDAEFLRRLQALTADDDVWEGFDPSSWRCLKTAEDGTDVPTDQVSASGDDDGGDDWDDSGGMILSVRHLTPAERMQHPGWSKLNKARAFAADEEPGFVRDATHLESVKWKETGLAMGDISPEGWTFVPWRLVEEYPNMFVGKRNGIRAAPLFTLEALHQNRVWDLYYIHRPADTRGKPVVFVPTHQFQHLLDIVNAKLATQLTIPPGKNEERFNMSFGLGNTPRPRFLGRSDSPECFKTLCKGIPKPKADDDLKRATHLGREEFLRLLSTVDAAKKDTAKSRKKHWNRVRARKAWGRSIKRVQRYLGLRQRALAPVTGAPSVLDLHLQLALNPEKSVMFVAIDVEAYEHNQALLTEVGIATLDTADIQNVAPGDGGEGWFPLIRARHIRVKENTWALNRQYVHGCADRFSFGMSEFICQADIPSILAQLIDEATFMDPVDGILRQRQVVLVFHESSSDVKYLRTLGYNVYNAQNVLEVVDTRELHQYVTRSNDSASLESVLRYLGITYQYLHNAGNDAVYTLRAMVGLAVKKRMASLENVGKKPLHHVPYSEFKEKEGWSSGGEDSDGGEPVRPVNPYVVSDVNNSRDDW
ncbi:hypothetical protein VTK56DRAFT_5728 [Thermocarpiscus australiensis]